MRLAFVALLLCACGAAAPSPCTPAILAGIEADYSSKVLVACKGLTLETCPVVPTLKAQRAMQEQAASCR